MKLLYTIVAVLLIGATIIVFMQREEETKATVPVSQGTNDVQASPAQGAGLNPPHGQPGHRCELAVGAPLTSAPASSPTAPAQVTPMAPVQNTPAATSAPAGVTKNPEHGMPGHRCDLAVGAPL